MEGFKYIVFLFRSMLYFWIFLFIVDCIEGYEPYRLAPYNQYEFLNPYGDLIRPIITAYRGNVGKKTVLRCQFRLRRISNPEINWYKKATNESMCISLHSTIRNREGIFCLELRTKFRRRKKKFVSRLVIQKSTVHDSGLYMCVLSVGSEQITNRMTLSFDETWMPSIRLVDSKARHAGEGRVEIYHNKHWNKVSIHRWETPEANVICRILGYRYGGEPRFLMFDGDAFYKDFFLGTKYIKTPFISLNCPLNGTKLQDCKGWNVTKNDGFPVGVTCRRTPVKIPDKPIRFADTSPTEGRVEVFHSGYWGTICMEDLTDNEVSTICRSMGYRYGGTKYKAWDTYLTNPGVGPIMITGLKCPENAMDFNQCSHNGYGNICCGCTHEHDLAVRCHVKPDEEYGKKIRLAGLGRDDKGRVELLVNGTWVMIRPYWLQFPEANLLCKLLGFRLTYGKIWF